MKNLRQSLLNQPLWFCLGAVLSGSLGLAIEARPEMEFEHSFVGGPKLFVSDPGGAGWGTDDSLKAAIQIDEKSLPAVYKTTATLVAQPTRVKVQPSAQDRFENGEAKVYRALRLCVDQSLPQPQLDFQFALKSFLNSLVGSQDLNKLIAFSRVEWGDFSNPQAIGACSVVFRRGQWQEFPYDQFKALKQDHYSDWRNQIFALFYQHRVDAVPIVTLHPDVLISYNPEQDTAHWGEDVYLSRPRDLEGNQPKGVIEVDGRVLFLHELGHVLGFSHLKRDQPSNLQLSANLMGLNGDDRSEQDLELRFRHVSHLWEKLDLQQKLNYRMAVNKQHLFNGELTKEQVHRTRSLCLKPNESIHLAVGPVVGPSILKIAGGFEVDYLLLDIEHARAGKSFLDSRRSAGLKSGISAETSSALMDLIFPRTPVDVIVFREPSRFDDVVSVGNGAFFGLRAKAPRSEMSLRRYEIAKIGQNYFLSAEVAALGKGIDLDHLQFTVDFTGAENGTHVVPGSLGTKIEITQKDCVLN